MRTIFIGEPEGLRAEEQPTREELEQAQTALEVGAVVALAIALGFNVAVAISPN